MLLPHFIAGALLAVSATAFGQAPPAPPYSLTDTEVRDIRATRLQRDYQLYVSLPASYRSSTRTYPLLFVTDANYAFPLVRSIGRRVGNHGKDLEEFILVGLSYASGDTPEYSRRRDYTPTAGGTAKPVSDMPGRAPVFGEAEGYRRFIAEEVFPFIARSYRADMSRRIFAGHSYGALLGAHMLFAEPGMFSHYILGSPSLWYDRKVMFAREREHAATRKDLPARVFMAVGEYEAIKPRSRNPRYSTEFDMVQDMREFERVLKSRKYPSLRIHSQVIADEDHLTVAPAIITRGLLWALPASPGTAERRSAGAGSR